WSRIPFLPVGQPPLGDRVPGDLFRASSANATLVPFASFAHHPLAAALAVVPPDVRIRMCQTAQRRSCLAQPDGAAVPLRNPTFANVDRVVCPPISARNP